MSNAAGDRPANPIKRLSLLMLLPILAIGLTIVVYGTLTEGFARVGAPDDDQSEALEIMEVRAFDYVDQFGQPVDRSVFEDEWTVLTFIFTRCPLICPTTTGNLYQLASRLDDTRVRTAVLTIDPVNDQPEVMRSYLDRFGFDPTKTTALIPPNVEEARRFITEGLRLGLDVDQEMLASDDVEVLQQITHTTRFLLIGPDAKVRRWVAGDDQEAVARFATQVRLDATGR